MFSLFSQYVEDDEDEQSEDGDGSVSPRPFDRWILNSFIVIVSK